MVDAKTPAPGKPTTGEACRIRFTPDGGVEVQCDTPDATRKFVDAALAGNVTVKFIPKVMPTAPAPAPTKTP